MVDISGLERFKSSLSKAKENLKANTKNPKIKQIIAIAVEEIEKAYSITKVKVEVIVEENKNGFTIYAKDKNANNPIIAFDEFGTGFYAKGSYLGKLPTQTISFTIKDKRTKQPKKISTKGWEYYYWENRPNPDTKVIHGGVYGWMTPNGLFHTGQMANSTMYKACKKIIKRVKSEVV